MDIIFNCPNCQQELEVDASGIGSEIECPACAKTIVIPPSDNVKQSKPLPEPPSDPVKAEKHFVVPVHSQATEGLIQKPTARTLDIIAKEGDKKLRIKTFKRSDCQEVGKDHFDEKVSEFLEKVGQANIVSVAPINYSFVELGSRQLLTDYGVMIVFKG
jgi:hypothetical protein